MKVSDLLVNAAAAFPEKTAAVYLEHRVSFGELNQSALRLAARLQQLELEPGSRVSILFENCLEYLIGFFGVQAAGLVAVPLDTSLAPQNLNFMLADCGARVLIVQGKYRRHLQTIVGDNTSIQLLISDKQIQAAIPSLPVELLGDIAGSDTDVSHASESDRHSDDLAAIFYTSGSTGEPKGVMLSHRNLVSNTQATVQYLKLSKDDSVLVILPFYYIYGNSLLLTHIACGGTVVIDNRFMYPEVVLDALEESKATGFSGVPSTFMIALNKSSIARRELKDLRYITQAGGAMAPEVTRQLIAACPNQEIWVMYGQTEAAPRATYLPPEMLEAKLGSIGIPVPGVEIKIADSSGSEVPTGETGEIMIHGPNVMLGYWNRPEETAEVVRDGWLITGDLARRDDDGYIYVVGRKREIIKAAGHRVSAKEVEEHILEHDEVAEAVVLGLPDEILGESIQAVVVLKSGCEANEKEIQAWCQKRLAAFKVPKAVWFVEDLPKLQSGKPNKLKLKQFCSAMMQG